MDVASPEEAAWEAFVARWAELHGRAEVDGRALLALAIETVLWMPDVRGGAGELARFGIALAKRRDRVFGGWRIGVRRDGKRKVNVYGLIARQSRTPAELIEDPVAAATKSGSVRGS